MVQPFYSKQWPLIPVSLIGSLRYLVSLRASCATFEYVGSMERRTLRRSGERPGEWDPGKNRGSGAASLTNEQLGSFGRKPPMGWDGLK